MNGTDGLICRARELAALADNATPGRWRVWPWRVVRAEDATYICSAYPVDSGNAELIAAAPEMAHLLRELADALEAEIGLAERMASELDRMHEELVRARGRTCYECPDCGAVCVGR